MKARPTIILVAKGSPADQAGLEAGDEIVAMAGRVISEGAAGLAAVREVQAGSRGGPLDMTVSRDGVEHEVEVSSARTCSFGISMDLREDVLLFHVDPAQKEYLPQGPPVIFVSSGMMDFVRSDDELVLVIGHQMGHLLGHHEGRRRSAGVEGAIVGGLFGALMGMPSMVNIGAGGFESMAAAGFEEEADRLAIDLASRAGYDASVARALWRRMVAENPRGLHFPPTADEESAESRLEVVEAARSASGPSGTRCACIRHACAARSAESDCEAVSCAASCEAAVTALSKKMICPLDKAASDCL